jgi:hypothetical protein
MGMVLDGTFDIIDGALRVTRAGANTGEILRRIRELAAAAKAGQKSPQDALNEALDFLPSEAAAAVKKLGTNNPLAALVLIIWILSGVSTIATNVSGMMKTSAPNDPPAPPAIHNHITINNHITPSHSGREGVSSPIKREQLRRLKQMESQQAKRGKRHKDSPKGKGKQ